MLLKRDHVGLTAAGRDAALGGKLRDLGGGSRQDGVARTQARIRGDDAEVLACDRQAGAAVVLVGREAAFFWLLHLPAMQGTGSARQHGQAQKLFHQRRVRHARAARPAGAGQTRRIDSASPRAFKLERARRPGTAAHWSCGRGAEVMVGPLRCGHLGRVLHVRRKRCRPAGGEPPVERRRHCEGQLSQESLFFLHLAFARN